MVGRFYSFSKFCFVRTILLIVVCALCSINVKAGIGDSFDEPLILEVDSTYDVSQYSTLYAQFTAPYDGVLTILYYNTDMLKVYTDTAMTEEIEIVNTGYSPTASDVEMTGGKTYYLYRKWLLNSDSIKVLYSVEGVLLELQEISPAEGTLLSAAKGGLSFHFNRAVESIDQAILSVGDEFEYLTPTATSDYVIFYVAEEMKAWYDEGIIEKGTEMTVTLSGVVDSKGRLYNGDGICSGVFTVDGPVVALKSATNTPTTGMPIFYSYMPPGDDAIVTLEFDGDIDTTNLSKAKIQFGNLDKDNYGGYYQEELPIVCPDARTVTVDLSGKLRRIVDMLTYTPTEDDYEEGYFKNITLKIPSLMAPDGQFLYTGISSSYGSFSYSYTYEERINGEVASDYTLDGSSFDNSTQIEIWLRGSEYLTFSGVTFKYITGGVTTYLTVPADELVMENDPDEDGALLIYVTIPDIATDEGSKVVVSFADLTSQDGLDYTSDLSQTYKSAGRTITAVDLTSVSTEVKTGNVYSVNGQLVRRNVSTSNLNGLQKGIYIVDGKKVVVK